MDDWIQTISTLCLFGFFKNVRPSESFLTQYLEQWKNLTMEEINNEIYPVWTYSYVSLLFVVLFITDFLRYKPVIVIEGISYVVTWSLLLWAQGVLAMQFMEVLYGVVTATEIAYFSYIYAKVPKERYQFATALVRAATLFGNFLSGTLAQTLTSTGVMDYHTLNYISLADVSMALTIALFIPSVPVSIYFHRQKQSISLNEEPVSVDDNQVAGSIDGKLDDVVKIEKSILMAETQKIQYERVPFKKAALVIWTDLKDAYSNSFQIKWCLWWALGTCGFEQASNYAQSLCETIYPSEEHDDIYQGAVDAVAMLLGGLAALSIGFLKVNWDKWGEMTLGIVSILQGVLLMVASQTDNIWVAYVFIAAYAIFYFVLITIATYQVAKKLREDSYGLIFGCNQFIALLLQTILTVIVVDENCLDSGPRTQFLIYGGYTAVVGLLYLIIAVYSSGLFQRVQRAICS